MIKVKPSLLLINIKPELHKLLELLSTAFDYVSILGIDTHGFKYEYSDRSSSLEESMWTDRGFVVRLFKSGKVVEYSFNSFTEGDAEKLLPKILHFAEKAIESDFRLYPLPKEEKLVVAFSDEVKTDPSGSDPGSIFLKLEDLYRRTLQEDSLVFNARIVYEWVKVSKIFLSSNKDLEQNYMWSQGYVVPMVRDKGTVKILYSAVSGIEGEEILDKLKKKIPATVHDAVSLLSADNLVPGEYDVICSPDISGLIAHEAFGHGVEMDMFVLNRAKGKYYIGQQIANPLVSMRDTAYPVRHAGSYRFDDEGNSAGSTLVIDRGILKEGLSDELSASFLRTAPTGNGRRQSYKNKAYARMTNTYFETGNDDIEAITASIEHGYLIDYTQSGMEDPKNWGLQAIAFLGREIRNGKFTGRIVSPVVMTGYVPDILKNITMISGDIELSGSGYCGKGWKEFVKVSSGGPYIKTKMRLG